MSPSNAAFSGDAPVSERERGDGDGPAAAEEPGVGDGCGADASSGGGVPGSVEEVAAVNAALRRGALGNPQGLSGHGAQRGGSGVSLSGASPRERELRRAGLVSMSPQLADRGGYFSHFRRHSVYKGALFTMGCGGRMYVDYGHALWGCSTSKFVGLIIRRIGVFGEPAPSVSRRRDRHEEQHFLVILLAPSYCNEWISSRALNEFRASHSRA